MPRSVFLFLKLKLFGLFILRRSLFFLLHKVIDGLLRFGFFRLLFGLALFIGAPTEDRKFCNVHDYDGDQKDTNCKQCASALYAQ